MKIPRRAHRYPERALLRVRAKTNYTSPGHAKGRANIVNVAWRLKSKRRSSVRRIKKPKSPPRWWQASRPVGWPVGRLAGRSVALSVDWRYFSIAIAFSPQINPTLMPAAIQIEIADILLPLRPAPKKRYSCGFLGRHSHVPAEVRSVRWNSYY